MLAAFVAQPGELERLFDAPADERAAIVARWTAHRYWPALFASAFADATAARHVRPGGDAARRAGLVPRLLPARFERGLGRDDAARNPFLQHVLLGCYRARRRPALYVRARRAPSRAGRGSSDTSVGSRRASTCSACPTSSTGPTTRSSPTGPAGSRAPRAPAARCILRQLNNRARRAPLASARLPLRRCARPRPAGARPQPLLQPRRSGVPRRMSARLEFVGPRGAGALSRGPAPPRRRTSSIRSATAATLHHRSRRPLRRVLQPPRRRAVHDRRRRRAARRRVRRHRAHRAAGGAAVRRSTAPT